MEELSPGVSSAGMSWKNVTCKQVLVLRTHLGSTMGVGLAGAAPFPPWPAGAGRRCQGEYFPISLLRSAGVDLPGLLAAVTVVRGFFWC